MTGGQRIEGEPFEGAALVPDIVAQLKAFGVGQIVVVNDGRQAGYPAGALPADVDVRPRTELDAVQRELREVPGVTAGWVYDQACAAELRRLRKHKKIEQPTKRVVINELVCEGCGDCNAQSNCIAVEPVETQYGRKRQINQAACNIDLSCLRGYCPSFVVIDGATPVPPGVGKIPTRSIGLQPIWACRFLRPTASWIWSSPGSAEPASRRPALSWQWPRTWPGWRFQR